MILYSVNDSSELVSVCLILYSVKGSAELVSVCLILCRIKMDFSNLILSWCSIQYQFLTAASFLTAVLYVGASVCGS
jgi:hypothetical protein